jgi:hypothetical protein
MWRALFADRMKLRVHYEERPVLVVDHIERPRITSAAQDVIARQL